MPSYIMKVHPEGNLYAKYSTIVDNFTDVGTKEALMSYNPTEFPIERFDRADKNGTSALYGDEPFPGSYECKTIFIREDNLDFVGTLARKDLAAYLAEENDEKRLAILTPVVYDDAELGETVE